MSPGQSISNTVSSPALKPSVSEQAASWTASPWRVAAYFAPDPAHPLWAAGCAWLGRDAASGVRTAPLIARVDQPARYGFHATLKAPMRLGDGVSWDDVAGVVSELARDLSVFPLPALSVGWMGDFLALQLTEPLTPGHALQSLADRCVRRLDPLRAPLTALEWARRENAGLDPRSRELTRHWGYPKVFERWVFHMTLSDSLPQISTEQREVWLAQAQAHFAEALAVPLQVDAISLFVEPHPGSPLRMVQRVPLPSVR